MLDHVSIQCSDIAASAAFYDAVLAPAGRRSGHGVRPPSTGYGAGASPTSGSARSETAGTFRESHLAFAAPDRDAVRAFFEAAVATGAEVLHEPRVWPEYHPDYFGAFVRDPDGNNVEAVCHRPD